MKIGIVGNGFVGKATARCFMELGEVRVFDVVPELATHSLAEVLECDFVFVCLPTPDDCDTRIIDAFFGQDAVRASKALFVIKSTVPVGTTRRLCQQTKLRILHSPEFLTARCAIVDAMVPARMIVGVPFDDGEYDTAIVNLYVKRFPGTPIHVMTSDASELVKLACNSFFALKVWYFNVVKELCDNGDIEWEAVRKGILSDGRITPHHTMVPGPTGRGYSGACLPKDMEAFANTVFTNGSDISYEALTRVIADNERMRKE